jgi:hypothetical protein
MQNMFHQNPEPSITRVVTPIVALLNSLVFIYTHRRDSPLHSASVFADIFCRFCDTYGILLEYAKESSTKRSNDDTRQPAVARRWKHGTGVAAGSRSQRVPPAARTPVSADHRAFAFSGDPPPAAAARPGVAGKQQSAHSPDRGGRRVQFLAPILRDVQTGDRCFSAPIQAAVR